MHYLATLGQKKEVRKSGKEWEKKTGVRGALHKNPVQQCKNGIDSCLPRAVYGEVCL